MRFKISVPEMQPDHGSVPVSWCVDEDVLQLLAEHGACKPMVLLVAAPILDEGDDHDPGLEVRTLTPLIDGLAYIHFLTHGPHRIHAAVVWSDITKYNLRGKLLDKKDGDWRSHLLRYDISDFKPSIHLAYHCNIPLPYWGIIKIASGKYQAVATNADLMVPEGCFAKDPPEILRKLVAFFYAKTKPVDTCDFRSLVMRSIAWGIVFIPINFLIRLVITAGATIALCKNVNWKVLTRFLDHNLDDAFENIAHGNYLWPTGKLWTENLLLWLVRPFLMLLNPLLLIPMGGLSHMRDAETWLTVSGTGMAILAAGIIFIEVVLMVIYLVRMAIVHLISSNLAPQKEGVPKPAPVYLREDTVSFLSCKDPSCDDTVTDDETPAPTAPPRSLKSIPLRYWRPRTIFYATKARVCKPFARG